MTTTPTPTPTPTRPVYLRKWFLIGAGVVAFLIVGQVVFGNRPPTPAPATSRPAASAPVRTPAPPVRTGEQVAADVDRAVREGLAIDSYPEACGSVMWACLISEVKAGGPAGGVEVHVQEALTRDEAERVALNVLNFSVRQVPDVEWVIVYDVSRSVRGQLPRSASPLA